MKTATTTLGSDSRSTRSNSAGSADAPPTVTSFPPSCSSLPKRGRGIHSNASNGNLRGLIEALVDFAEEKMNRQRRHQQQNRNKAVRIIHRRDSPALQGQDDTPYSHTNDDHTFDNTDNYDRPSVPRDPKKNAAATATATAATVTTPFPTTGSSIDSSSSAASFLPIHTDWNVLREQIHQIVDVRNRNGLST